jgi:hypothetical protein
MTMPKFEVTIQAHVTKTYAVEADDADQAYEAAHEAFSVLTDDAEEHYTQETLDIIQLKEETQS